MQLINTGPEPFFEDVVNHMAAICNTPIAVVGLEEGGRCWMNQAGLEKGAETGAALNPLGFFGRERSVVPDFSGRFAWAKGRPPRAYISMPLVLNGVYIGSLVIADTRPREWTEFEINYMIRSARLVAGHFEARAALAERDRAVKLEQQLREAAVLYSAVISSMKDGLVVHTSTGQILATNPAAEKILGYSASQLVKMSITDMRWNVIDLSGARIESANIPAMRVFTSQEPTTSQVIGFNMPTGDRRWVDVNSVRLDFGKDNGCAVAATTFQDVTERVEKERLLARAAA